MKKNIHRKGAEDAKKNKKKKKMALREKKIFMREALVSLLCELCAFAVIMINIKIN